MDLTRIRNQQAKTKNPESFITNRADGTTYKGNIMNTRAFTNTLGTLAIAAFIFAAGVAQGAILVNPNKI